MLHTVTSVDPVDGCENLTASDAVICTLTTDKGTIDVTRAGATKLNGNLIYSHACEREGCPDCAEVVGQCYNGVEITDCAEIPQTNGFAFESKCVLELADGTTLNRGRYTNQSDEINEQLISDCPSSCSDSTEWWHYPSPTVCSDPDLPAQTDANGNIATSPYPNGFVSADNFFDNGVYGTVTNGGVCYEIGSPSSITACEADALKDEGVPEGYYSEWSKYQGSSNTSCRCCIIENDPQTHDCDQFYDNMCSPITGSSGGGLNMYNSGTTYQAGAEVWAQAGAGGGFAKYRLTQGTSFNVEPWNPVAVTTCAGCPAGEDCYEAQCTSALYTDSGCSECQYLYEWVGLYSQGVANEYSKIANAEDAARFTVNAGDTIWVKPTTTSVQQNVPNWQVICSCVCDNSCGVKTTYCS